MAEWQKLPPHNDIPDPTTPLTLEELEAKARQAIAKAAVIEVRGWDTQHLKTAELQRVNAALDDYNAARQVADLEESISAEEA